MKIRKGFVSNSSSTSFTCEVCGETCSGMDMGLSDFEMYQCENGHCFCEGHMKKEISITDIRDFVLKDKYISDEFKEKIQKMNDMGYLYEEEETMDKYRYSSSSKTCPICNFEEISESDVYKYLMIINDLDKEKILKRLKENFPSYKEFRKLIYPNKK